MGASGGAVISITAMPRIPSSVRLGAALSGEFRVIHLMRVQQSSIPEPGYTIPGFATDVANLMDYPDRKPMWWVKPSGDHCPGSLTSSTKAYGHDVYIAV